MTGTSNPASLAKLALQLLAGTEAALGEAPRAALPSNVALRQALVEHAAIVDASADTSTIERALLDGEVLIAMRGRDEAGRQLRMSDHSLMLVSGAFGQRILPVFTSQDALTIFAAERPLRGAAIPGARAIEIAQALNFEALEFDRGSPHALRLGPETIARIRRGLAAPA